MLKNLADALYRWWHGIADVEHQGVTANRLACGCPAPDVWLECPHCAERRCYFHGHHDCHGGPVDLRDLGPDRDGDLLAVAKPLFPAASVPIIATELDGDTLLAEVEAMVRRARRGEDIYSEAPKEAW